MKLVSEKFEIESQEWVEKIAPKMKAELDRTGAAVLKGFITDRALEDAVKEARAKAPHAFVATKKHNVYLLPEQSQALAQDHMRNKELDTVVASVACDELAKSGALHELYFGAEGDMIINLVSKITGKRLYRLADPLGACSINVFHPGMEHAWHFDESEYTITLCLQTAEKGGEFMYSPPIRKSQDDLAADKVEEIISTEQNVSKLDFEPGTLAVFCGQRSLHCVKKNLGNTPRLVAVLCYATSPNVYNTPSVQKQFWGRSVL